MAYPCDSFTIECMPPELLAGIAEYAVDHRMSCTDAVMLLIRRGLSPAAIAAADEHDRLALEVGRATIRMLKSAHRA